MNGMITHLGHGAYYLDVLSIYTVGKRVLHSGGSLPLRHQHQATDHSCHRQLKVRT